MFFETCPPFHRLRCQAALLLYNLERRRKNEKMKNEKKVMSSVPPVGLVGSLTSEFIPAGTYVSQGLQVVRYISDQTQGYNYYLTAGPGVSTCFPSSRFPFSGSYYSPGRCPSGYYAACTRTGGNSVGDAIETTVTCCPMYVCGIPR